MVTLLLLWSTFVKCIISYLIILNLNVLLKQCFNYLSYNVVFDDWILDCHVVWDLVCSILHFSARKNCSIDDCLITDAIIVMLTKSIEQ